MSGVPFQSSNLISFTNYVRKAFKNDTSVTRLLKSLKRVLRIKNSTHEKANEGITLTFSYYLVFWLENLEEVSMLHFANKK